jgi:hypothetical protein
MIFSQMMTSARRVIGLFLLLTTLLGGVSGREVLAANGDPVRTTTITIPFTEYEWWLIRWSDNAIVCVLRIDHEGLPTAADVRTHCGQELYNQWIATPGCAIGAGDSTVACQGLYMHLVTFQQKERQVLVELPPPAVYVNLEGCTPIPPENRCASIPNLLLIGDEPLPNERITAIRGFLNGAPFVCEGESCSIPLVPTPLEGVTVEFWAESSFGDESKRYTALVRVIDTGVTNVPGSAGWYVDVVSSQWSGAELASCVRIWKALPPVGTPPTWLSTPSSGELMASERPYFYLAGRLISQGVVIASECPNGGLLPNGYANTCGLELARPVVEEWQNQFDERIVQVAQETGIPAQLMKNLFAQESQFWPGVFRVPHEYGLGQITSNGADTILLWNRSFFEQFCPLIFAEDACARGYLRLPDQEKAILRGALALQAKADCPECPAGINLNNTVYSIQLFAHTLQANCEQVRQIVQNATQRSAGSVASYEDLWRLTIANYHAGPGCVSYAVHTAWGVSGRLTWEGISTRFTEPCQGVVPYVDKITR